MDRVDEALRSGLSCGWKDGPDQGLEKPRAGRREGRAPQQKAGGLFESGVRMTNRNMFAGERPDILSSS